MAGLDRPGIKFTLGNFQRIIGEILIAEQQTILIHACGKQADAAFKISVDADAHAGHMPQISVTILHGADMACGSDESAQTGAEGGIHAEGEGTQRRITHHIAVTVNGLFRGWRAILQVIPTVQLAHVGAFHERVAAAKKDVVQRLLKLRTILFLLPGKLKRSKPWLFLSP